MFRLIMIFCRLARFWRRTGCKHRGTGPPLPHGTSTRGVDEQRGSEGIYHELTGAPRPDNHAAAGRADSAVWTVNCREAGLPPLPPTYSLPSPTLPYPSLPYPILPPKPGRKEEEEEDPIYQEISEKSNLYAVIKKDPTATTDDKVKASEAECSDNAVKASGRSDIVYGLITTKQVARFVPCTQTAIVRPQV